MRGASAEREISLCRRVTDKNRDLREQSFRTKPPPQENQTKDERKSILGKLRPTSGSSEGVYALKYKLTQVNAKLPRPCPKLTNVAAQSRLIGRSSEQARKLTEKAKINSRFLSLRGNKTRPCLVV
jgi:hypothetical protein